MELSANFPLINSAVYCSRAKSVNFQYDVRGRKVSSKRNAILTFDQRYRFVAKTTKPKRYTKCREQDKSTETK